MKRHLTILLAVCALAQPLLSRAEAALPDELVKEVSTQVLDVVKGDKAIQNGNSKRTQELIEEKVLPHFDFTHMMSFAMGRDWKLASPEQQKILTNEFKTLLVRTYSNAFLGFKNETVTVRPGLVPPAATDATVRTLINRPSGQPVHLDYTLAKTPSGWKVYDVIVAGSSLVTVYRQKFHQQVEAGGLDGLVKFLQDGNRRPAAPDDKK